MPDAPCLTTRITIEVAKATDADPRDLPTLHDIVDPEALAKLFESPPGGTRDRGRVVFPYAGCEVTVTADGSIDVTSQYFIG